MTINKKIRLKVYEKCNKKCGYCGDDIELKNMQVDHIIPKAFYISHIKNKNKIPKFLEHLGENDVDNLDNLLPTCRSCNKWKSANHLELFRSELSEQINRLNKYNSNYRIAKKYGLIKEIEKNIQFYFENINI